MAPRESTKRGPIHVFTACIALLAGMTSIFAGAQSVHATDEINLQILLREADKAIGKRAIRTKRSNSWGALGGPTFSGNWAGTYSLAKANCSTNIRSFNFRHSLLQTGASASLSTSHDGGFYGSSRDRGRRLEFAKTITLRNGVTCGVAVIYKDLAKDTRSTNTGYAVSCSGCTWAYGARARR
jgi:hypothetical protein